MAGYLADLGVTHAYSSPLLRSAEGSNHGYDTVDHAHIDEARGGREGFDRFVAALHEHGLGPGARPGAQPHGRRRRRRRAVVVGRAPARPGAAPTPTRSTSTGSSAAARSASRSWARRTTSRARGGRTASCTTTTTASRSRPAPSSGTPAGGARPAALRAGRLAARRLRPELPAVLRDQHPRRPAGRGPGDLRRHARPGAAAGARRRGRRAADRPPGRPGRPEGLSRPAGRGVGRPLDGRGEDPRAR